MAGHLIECSGQVTGGNYSFFVHVAGATSMVEPPASEPRAPVEPVKTEPVETQPVETATHTTRAPLGVLIGTRSGDKGGNANLGVFTRSADAYAWIHHALTVDRLRELLPEAAPLRIERYEFPNLWALNFVIHGLLGEGVAASTPVDAQAKSLGEWLRARVVDVPVALLD